MGLPCFKMSRQLLFESIPRKKIFKWAIFPHGPLENCFNKERLSLFDQAHEICPCFKACQNSIFWSFCCGEVETNPASIHEDAGLIPGHTQWLWCREAAAAPI